MKKMNKKSKICISCYHRLDCDILPHREDWCVYYKKDLKIDFREKNNQNLKDTVEISDDELKSLFKKLK